ncbi:hypothetical protein MJG53_004165 [Ovis ammon polii x Ovis aries]|uniref:Uncharacterized protein n=1 Tax=Ovis ammon polii x Ovis aries TaxID=2918886 RepID=A0ACB9V9I4_9CETA|nr:hypothetical protein MJG53_004165 [Ovis ammon polii x Ovis aries]
MAAADDSAQVFLGALSFVYFAKALAEGYLKSTITQIERRFDIPSSLVGIIDGSFEIGNLLVIAFVSYFGAKLHRPKIIGAGCLIMGVGTLLIAMPQFFMEQYKYERYSPISNSTLSISPCLLDSNNSLSIPVVEKSQSKINNECQVDASSSMWVYVFLGNLLRGFGETPIQPLGIAYLDDFASQDNAAFYIDHITITPKDPQWVGAWWLGYLIAGSITLLAAVPFWCLPRTLARPRSREDSSSSSEKSKFIMDDLTDYQTPPGEKAKIMEMARDFLPSLKSLFGNPVYFLYLCASTVQFNSLFGMVTYKPKYIEQQYGQSASKANFVIEPNLSLIMNELSFQIATQDANVQRQNGNPYVVRMESRMHRLVLLVVKPPPGVERLLCIKPQLKSFALGIYTLAVRVLGIFSPNSLNFQFVGSPIFSLSISTNKRMFLAALSLSFISKALGAIIMKSSITQIERRFDISSSTVGLIDGSFEIGWEKDSGSYMWIYVLMGNMLRGIGETPIGPLGISYIDDFAEEGHSSLYLGNLLAVTMIGPIIGFVLVSQFSKMYVDIGYVDLSTIRITPKDSRWVGAWWLGFLAAGLISIISSIPFFFLPKTLDKPNKEKKASASSISLPMKNEEKSQMASLTKTGQNVTDTITGFLQSLKSILTNPLYVLTLFLTLLQASSHIGSVTYVFKYVEQQYGNSASETSILLGFITIPSLAAGMFTGGFIVKKFKFTLVGIAKFSLCTHLMSFLFHLLNFALICENKSVAGLTLTYDGNVEPELKSLAMGFHSLTIRTLGGIPAPIYFGALIDRACMKWSINNYGKQGSCRIYNSLLYGHTFFGLTTGLKFPALVLFVVLIFAMKKKYQGKDIKASENETKAVNEANSGPLINDVKVDHETHI